MDAISGGPCLSYTDAAENDRKHDDLCVGSMGLINKELASKHEMKAMCME